MPNLRKRQIVTGLGTLYLLGVIIAGCSIYMRSSRPEYRDVNVIQPGAPRSDVINELGVPEHSVETNGKRVDTYRFDPNAQSHGKKVAMTSVHFIADAATLGLWEIVGTPIELASGQSLTTYVVTYSADGKVENIQTSPSGAD